MSYKLDLQEVAAHVTRLAARFGMRVSVEFATTVPTAAADVTATRTIINPEFAARTWQHHSLAALDFFVLHEIGHLLAPSLRGRRAERWCDAFALTALLVCSIREHYEYDLHALILGIRGMLSMFRADRDHDSGGQRAALIARRFSAVFSREGVAAVRRVMRT